MREKEGNFSFCLPSFLNSEEREKKTKEKEKEKDRKKERARSGLVPKKREREKKLKIFSSNRNLKKKKNSLLITLQVRHPGVGHAVARDFGIMMAAAALATALVPSLREARLDETLRQFEAPLREQVDLSREADHLWQFVFNFRDRPDVRFPQPVFPLVSPSVLVETFEEGGPIGDHVAAGPAGKHGAALAAIGSAAVLRMLLCDNLVHADLHPGNILVRLDPPPLLPSSVGEGGSGGLAITQPLRAIGCAALRLFNIDPPRSWLRPSLVLLDVGMTTSLGARDRDTMVALFTAFSRGDGRGVAEHALHFSEACGERQRAPDPEGFKAAMDVYFRELDRERALAARPGGTPTDGGKALAGVLELIRQHRVSLPVRKVFFSFFSFFVFFEDREKRPRGKRKEKTHSFSLVSLPLFLLPSLKQLSRATSAPCSSPPSSSRAGRLASTPRTRRSRRSRRCSRRRRTRRSGGW